MPDSHLQVGAPDPERETSPIIDDDEKEDIEPEGPGSYCQFNGVAFRIREYVGSHRAESHRRARKRPNATTAGSHGPAVAKR